MKKVSSRSVNGKHRQTKAGVMTAPSSWRFVRSSVTGIRVIAVVVAAAAAACGVQESPEAPARVAAASSALTAEQRLAACAQDPRVVTGLASARICAGVLAVT